MTESRHGRLAVRSHHDGLYRKTSEADYIDRQAHHILHDFVPSWEITMPSTDAFALRQSDSTNSSLHRSEPRRMALTLSLVSVFARAGNDPWLEARKLAGLPKSAAAESLARSIAGMPKSIWPLQTAMTIADRLVVLLPTRPDGAGQSPSAPAISPKAKAARLVGIALLLVCVACMLAFQAGLFTASQPSNPSDSNLANFAASPGSPPDVQNLRSPSTPAR